jgi:hypothetical protein
MKKEKWKLCAILKETQLKRRDSNEKKERFLPEILGLKVTHIFLCEQFRAELHCDLDIAQH